MKIKKKHYVKIPKNVTIIHCTNKNLLICKSLLATKALILPLKIFKIKNLIFVSKVPNNKISKNILKNLNKLQGTLVAKIKMILVEVSNFLYKKLIFMGVGYRFFVTEDLANQLTLKLGFSHLIYHKIPKSLRAFNVKNTKMFVFGLSTYTLLTQTCASIRQCRAPEPYKGKGVLYYQEKIKLKKGKKT